MFAIKNYTRNNCDIYSEDCNVQSKCKSYFVNISKYKIWFGLITVIILLAINSFMACSLAGGQSIQIITNLNSFVGIPIWSLQIRDLDNNQTIPYVLDFNDEKNSWVVLTYGHHYLITASNLQIGSYKRRFNSYCNYRIKNFCQLESNGRINRGQSLLVRIEGDLTPNSNTYRCIVHRFNT